MSRNYMFQSAPAMWAIERHEGSGCTFLYAGSWWINVANIRGIDRQVVQEREDIALIFVSLLFMVAAILFALGVLDAGWRDRFLIAAGLFGFFGLVSLVESSRIRSVSYVRLLIFTDNGHVEFTTVDPADADMLVQRIADEQGRLRAER